MVKFAIFATMAKMTEIEISPFSPRWRDWQNILCRYRHFRHCQNQIYLTSDEWQ
jgi:hypothetical protein